MGDMRLEIAEADLRFLNESAQAELRDRALAYVRDLTQEAGRLEEAYRIGEGAPEIVSSMVRDADLRLRRGYAKPKRSFFVIAAGVLASLAALLAGYFLAKLGTDNGAVPWFVITIVAAILLQTYAEVRAS